VKNKRVLLFTLLAAGVLLLLGTGAFAAWRQFFPAPEIAVTETPDIAAMPAVDAAPASLRDNTLIQAVGMAPTTFNPIFATDAAAQSIIDKIYPRLLGQDPAGGFIVPSALAERWEISPDGRTYTFYLRNNIRWSDGEAVSAADFKFTYDALASPLVQSPYRDRTVGIARIEAPNPNTVVVTLAGPNCSMLHSLRQPLLPSHHFAADFSDLATHALNQAPTISAGPFLFVEQTPGEKVILARNPDYWQGTPQIAQWEVRVMPDPNARREALADGMIDLAYFAPNETIQTDLAFGASVTVSRLPTDSYSFLALNLADPANPQPGRGEGGSTQAQTPHPILGDLAVRQAIAAAIDYDRILSEVYNSRAARLAGYVPPVVTWAYAGNLPLPTYDPARAAQLLNDAGWTEENGSGVRTRAGQPLRLSLRTNDDNAQRVQMARILAEELAALGVDVQLEIVNFNELTATLLDQRFDLVVIGWENLGADPGNSPFWHTQADIPGAGFNFTSFQDAEVDGWLDSAARSPGCDLNQRATLYKQVQERISTTLPYIFLATQENAWVYQSRWQGIAPGPWDIDYNVATWQAP
jgi:peptide/nickel transport system substrate-binding protein